MLVLSYAPVFEPVPAPVPSRVAPSCGAVSQAATMVRAASIDKSLRFFILLLQVIKQKVVIMTRAVPRLVTSCINTAICELFHFAYCYKKLEVFKYQNQRFFQ
jgi:hypothetical protein